MTFVAVNILTVPEGRGEVLEQRFAGRAGSVEKAPGFERFECRGGGRGRTCGDRLDHLVLRRRSGHRPGLRGFPDAATTLD